MSLSKPMLIEPQSPSSGSPSSSLPKSLQTALLIGIPVALGAAGLYLWINSRKSESGKSPGTDVERSTADDSSPADNRPIYVKLKEQGNDCFKKSDYSGALEYYGKAIELGPPGPELSALYQNRAAVFEKLGDYVQVIREATAALVLNPKYIKALFRRSKAFRTTGFMDEALEDITAVCVFENFSNSVSIQTADEILKEIGSKEATEILQSKGASEPSDHSVEAFLRAFWSDPVSKWWREKSVMPGNGDVRLDLELQKTGFLGALAALKSHNYTNIISLCTEELENQDSKYKDETYLLRGTFYYLWGYGNETRDDLNQVISSTTASTDLRTSAWIKMATHYAMEHDYDKVTECFQKAEDLDSNNVDVFHQRGQVLLTKGDFDGASFNVNKAYSLRDDFPLTAGSKWYLEFRLASLSNEVPYMTEVVRQFQNLTRTFSDSPDIFNLYGQILIELGNFTEAELQFKRVIELDPKNAAVYVHRAMAKYQLNNEIAPTLSILREATKVDPKNEFVWETIGTLELQNGNLDGALEAIEMAIGLAKTGQELMMLCSLKKAAQVQKKVKNKFNVDVPSVVRLG